MGDKFIGLMKLMFLAFLGLPVFSEFTTIKSFLRFKKQNTKYLF